MDLYAEIIMDHFKHPRNSGEIIDTDLVFEDVNPVCGDKIKVFLKVEGGKICEMKYLAAGCAISKASASLLSEKVLGLEIDEIDKLSKSDMDELLGTEIVPGRTKCEMLALSAVKKILKLKSYE